MYSNKSKQIESITFKSLWKVDFWMNDTKLTSLHLWKKKGRKLKKTCNLIWNISFENENMYYIETML